MPTSQPDETQRDGTQRDGTQRAETGPRCRADWRRSGTYWHCGRPAGHTGRHRMQRRGTGPALGAADRGGLTTGVLASWSADLRRALQWRGRQQRPTLQP